MEEVFRRTVRDIRSVSISQSTVFMVSNGTGVMRALAGDDLLTAWERGRDLPEQEAALALLVLALPEHSANELANLPLGERNALLLEMRAATFGLRMEGLAVCPECGAQLELVFDARKLARELRAIDPPAPDEIAGRTMRPANTLDLLASSAAEDENQARRILLARTLNVAKPEFNHLEGFNAEVRRDRWLEAQPEPTVELLLRQFERLNASAEIRAQFHCDVCGSDATVDVDVARFLLREVAGAARRLMSEVHELASAYGWSERSIAVMSEARRAAYLEMLRG